MGSRPPANRDVAVVIPMYDEEPVIGAVVRQVRGSFSRVVCVDDGSADRSAAEAEAAGALVVRHHHNLGQGAALQTGITFALLDTQTRFVVTFDADGQHRVSDAVRMVQVARDEGLDVVLGSRFLGAERLDVPAGRKALLWGAVKFTRLTSRLPLTDAHNGLRVLSRRAASRLNITLNGMAHASEIIDQVAKADLRWREVPVTIDYTEYSRSKGQRNINAVNISLDLLARRLRAGR